MARRVLLELQYRLPDGLLVDIPWLDRQGISDSMRSRYVRQGWLQSPAHGIYRRPGPPLRWEHIVISLQSLLGFPVNVGGESALQLHGYRPYMNLGDRQIIHLCSPRALPTWVQHVPCNGLFRRIDSDRLWPDFPPAGQIASDLQTWDRFNPELPHGLRRIAWGTWRWPLVISTEERAAVEMMGGMAGKSSAAFDHSLRVAEGLHLDAAQVQHWLSTCHSRKAVRLFLWMAEYNRLPCLDQLDLTQINMGNGHLHMVSPGEAGRYCRRFNLTVPKDLYWDRDDINTVF